MENATETILFVTELVSFSCYLVITFATFATVKENDLAVFPGPTHYESHSRATLPVGSPAYQITHKPNVVAVGWQ